MGKWASKHRRYSESDEGTKNTMTKRRKRSTSNSQDELKSKETQNNVWLGKVATADCHNDAVTSIDVVSPNLCISASRDKTIAIQDLSKGTLLHRWNAHSQGVTKVCCCNSVIASASRDLTIGVWNLDNPKSCRGRLSGHTLVVSALDINTEGTKLFSGSRDNTVRIWDLETQQCMMENNISRNLVTDLKWAHQENMVIQTSEDKIIKIWDTRLLEVVHTFPVQAQIQTCCDLEEKRCLTGNNGFSGQGCQLNLWDLRHRQMLNEYRGHAETVSGCSFFDTSCPYTRFVSTSNDGTLRLWKDIQQASVSVQQLGLGTLTCIASLNDNTLLCGSLNHGIGVARVGSNDTLTVTS
uniref:F-box/WD repeat-containing protein 7 n=1 Tax=Phallusia mammillata TaxID=59560 RepID=A0A6F9DCW3_9ASCI|nr:F-box/WD repeat-containing protein 7 [Phallusia mammillata]